MRLRRTTGGLITALVVGTLGAAPPAAAQPGDTIHYYMLKYDTRPAGFPATSDPARTLSRADTFVRGFPGSSDFGVSGELVAAPALGDAVPLRIELGTVTGGTCSIAMTSTMSSPGRYFEWDADMAWAPVGVDVCGQISVLSTDGTTVLDRLVDQSVEHWTYTEVPYTPIETIGGKLLVKDVRTGTVRRGRWFDVWIRVGAQGNGATKILIGAEGRHLQTAPTQLDHSLVPGRDEWLPIAVKLEKVRHSTLTITVESTGSSADAWRSTTTKVKLRAGRRHHN
jgi:hypothetical protein